MGSDASVTHMIFFIAAVLVAGSMAGVFLSVGYEMAKKIELESDIAINNDPAMMPYDGTSLTLYVENTGSSTLMTSGLFVMMDGSYVNDTVLQVVGRSGAEWIPSTVLQITINISLVPGDHNVKVITGDGEADSLTFRV
jgi:archaellum component FlaG (FlaF/FlaG flagellin family)